MENNVIPKIKMADFRQLLSDFYFNPGSTREKCIFVWGLPGIGKSQAIREFCEDNGLLLRDVRLALKDPTDVQGLPRIKDNGTEWLSPQELLFNPNDKGILFLDEFNLAPVQVTNACYQLLTERTLNGKKLPDGIMVVCAGNPSSISSSANDLPSPLLNRFVHLELVYDLEQWSNYMLLQSKKTKIDDRIISFLLTKPELFYDEEMMKQEAEIFASPRSWSYVAKIFADEKLNQTVKEIVAQGTVGKTAAVMLLNYLEDTKKYQSPTDILLLGKEFKVESVSMFYGTFLSCCFYILREPESNIAELMKVLLQKLGEIKEKELRTFAVKFLSMNEILDKHMDIKTIEKLLK